MTTSRNIVLILEDSAIRLALMQEALLNLTSGIEIRSFDSAWSMRKELTQLLPQACLISLDFDLSNSSTKAPGDGMDAVQTLNRYKPACPVIVHTSLREDGQRMGHALRGGGWRVEQVVFNRRDAVGEWIKAAQLLISQFGTESGGCVQRDEAMVVRFITPANEQQA